jgi:hypothetical protein
MLTNILLGLILADLLFITIMIFIIGRNIDEYGEKKTKT